MATHSWTILSRWQKGRTFSSAKKKPARGVALMLVLVSLALMASAVAELSYNEFVLYRLAIYERDAAQAESLAAGGLNMSRLFLVLQDKLQEYLIGMASTGVSVPSYTIWNLLPLDSQYLRAFASGELAAMLGIDTVAAPGPTASEPKKFVAPKGGYGGFTGEVNIKIVDEESKISLGKFASTTQQNDRNAIRKLLGAFLQPDDYDYLFERKSAAAVAKDRQTLISNIYGYIDAQDKIADPYANDDNWGRSGAGAKSSLYREGVNPKNEYFDSFEELRLVPGMTDDIMDALSDSVTIYGEGGKLNFYSASDKVLQAVVLYCASNQLEPRLFDNKFSKEVIKEWNDYKNQGNGPVTPTSFMAVIEKSGIALDKPRCTQLLDKKSANFSITSTATVGKVTRKLTLVARIIGNTEELNYFSNT